jgi:hypothetical protein
MKKALVRLHARRAQRAVPGSCIGMILTGVQVVTSARSPAR